MPPYLAKSTSHSGFLVLSTQQNRQQAKPRGPPTANLSLVAPIPQNYPPLVSLKSAAATRPNLHSLNSWPAVQCNGGFCNASEGQRLPLTTTMASQKPHHSAKSQMHAFPGKIFPRQQQSFVHTRYEQSQRKSIAR